MEIHSATTLALLRDPTVKAAVEMLLERRGGAVITVTLASGKELTLRRLE